MTPHISITNVTDGIQLTLRKEWIVLPPDMVTELIQALETCRQRHDPTRVAPLPTVTPHGDPLT